MGLRTDLQVVLEQLLGSSNVYFQPPSNIQLIYPCIIYERSYWNTTFADNKPYSLNKRYSLTVIDRDPDSAIVDKVINLPMCSFDRHYVSDNLNHDVFNLYF